VPSAAVMAKMRRTRPRPVVISSAAKRTAVYRRWLRWWKLLRGDITTIAFHRHIYREVTAIVDANPAVKVPSVFFDWMRLAYVTDMASAVRRITDHRKDTISLRRLMDEIVLHPGVLSRRRFVGLYPGILRRAIAHRDFERFARPGAPTIDPRVVWRHRQELLSALRRLRIFVNKHVAHRSRYPMRHLPTYAEHDRCVDLLERLARDYCLLLEAAGLARVVPVVQYDWKKPFRTAWL